MVKVVFLTLALKVPRGAEDGDGLVHGPLADPEVVVDPFLEAGGLGEGVGFYAGAVSFHVHVSGSPFCREHA